MSLIEIRHWNGNVLHSIEADSIKAAVELLLGRGADLSGAVLSGAVLRDADLSGAVLREIPVVENIDAKILAAIEAGGKLKMTDWHTCKTTHCRAGWAVTLAGEAGLKLEEKFGPAVAGTLIYHASRPDKRIPDFYCDDATAMADIKACAAEQS